MKTFFFLLTFIFMFVFMSFRTAIASTNELAEVESGLRLPAAEVEICYHSMKVERGAIENSESVFGYGLTLEWYGLYGGFESCHDLTGVNGRRGRYNEIESFLGYGCAWGDLKGKAAYSYRSCAGSEHDTQAVELELEYETRWVSPFMGLECDTADRAGALYGNIGLEREWELTSWLKASTHGGIGFGNPYRNYACFGSERWAFRELFVGVALEIELCEHVKLVPHVDFYDYFTGAQRRVYDKFNGFAVVASCCLVAEF